VTEKEYIVVVQCDIVKERCSGYFCEKSFHERTGGFSEYPKETEYRTLYLTCGGCCGRALHRKLHHLTTRIRQKEGIGKERIIVQLSSCITTDNFHGPPCPHLDYLKVLLHKSGLDYLERTQISQKSATRREQGIYKKV
jgi:predicted metal-binding protein